MNAITKEMTIGEVLTLDRGTARVFMEHGMYCLGCPHSVGESLEDACAAHGIPCQPLVDALNEYFTKK